MSLKTQAKILRILEEQKFERVGGSKTIEVDVRIIAATNKDLMGEIKKGTFGKTSISASMSSPKCPLFVSAKKISPCWLPHFLTVLPMNKTLRKKRLLRQQWIF